MEIPINQQISLSDGSTAIVQKELGSGAQGIVYLVSASNGKQYALKCYHPREMNNDFYNNLKNKVISTRPPSNAFLWPKAIASYNGQNCGYVMDLAPKGFYELTDYFIGSRCPEAEFPSFAVRLQVALHICNAYMHLHRDGLCYQDINAGSFMIRPSDGQVYICDNDNVCANGKSITGITGFPRYRAIEVMEGETPNSDTDRMSMAIILYRVFMQDHPFEGIRGRKFPCMSEWYEKRYYGTEAIFVFDKQNDTNRPDPMITKNHESFWKVCPPRLKDAFQMAFCNEAIHNPKARLSDKDWKEILLEVRREMLVYISDKQDYDYYYDSTVLQKAGLFEPQTANLHFEDNTDYTICRHKDLYLSDEMTPIAKGVLYKNPKTGSGEFGLRNTSNLPWMLTTNSGNLKKIEPGKDMPLREGMHIRFTQSSAAKVIYVK